MIIAIPIEKDNNNLRLCQSFGRTKYFLIFNVDTNESQILYNNNEVGGAGIKAAQRVIDENIDSVILPRCGGNAYEVLKAANIKIYLSKSNDVEENIKALIDGKLSIIEEVHPGFHHGV